jgi:hypothetical protein
MSGGIEVPDEVIARTGPVASYEPLRANGFNAVTGGVWLLRGERDDVVLKVIVPPSGGGAEHGWASSDEPTHWNYWRREAEALRSGLSSTAYADAGVEGPRLLLAVDRADGAVELWCAAARGVPGVEQRADDVVALAGRLGTGQGAWVGRVPGLPWLSRRWLRQYVASKPYAPRRADWDHPVAVAAWPDDLRAGLRRLWDRRDRLIGLVEALPRTLAHLDVWPANVVGSTLLDWAFVGDGAAGEDVGNLVPDSFLDGFVPLEDLPAVAAEAPRAYAAACAAASRGRVDEATALLGVHAAGAAKYVWLAPLMLSRLDQPLWASYGGGPARPAADVLAHRRPVLELLVRWADGVPAG